MKVFYGKFQVSESVIMDILSQNLLSVSSQDDFTEIALDTGLTLILTYLGNNIIISWGSQSLILNIDHFVRNFHRKSYTISLDKPFQNLIYPAFLPRLKGILTSRILSNTNVFSKLSEPLIANILIFLDWTSLQNIALTNYSIFANQGLWRHLYHYCKGHTGFMLSFVNWKVAFFIDKQIKEKLDNK